MATISFALAMDDDNDNNDDDDDEYSRDDMGIITSTSNARLKTMNDRVFIVMPIMDDEFLLLLELILILELRRRRLRPPLRRYLCRRIGIVGPGWEVELFETVIVIFVVDFLGFVLLDTIGIVLYCMVLRIVL